MYKKVVEKYSLSKKDNLVISIQNGQIRVLINNDISVSPIEIDLKTLFYDIETVEGVVKKVPSLIELECVTEE
jgi:hypothetical protein